MCDATGLSQRCASRLTGLSLSTCRYEAQRPSSDAHLSGRITELALERRRFDYHRIWQLLRRKGLATERLPLHQRAFESRASRLRTDLLRRFRDEYLNEHWFSDIAYVRKTINDWRQNYNECRPHTTLNYQTPPEFSAGWRSREK